MKPCCSQPGNRRSATLLGRVLAASPRPEVQLLETIARREGLAAPTRSRVATLARPIARGDLSLEHAATIAASPARYFAALVNERIAASGAAARGLDRILENYALTLCRSFQEAPATAAAELSRFSALDLYLLLGYGRAEQEDTFFTGIFDRVLLPKLRTLPRPRPLSRLVEQTGGIRFRDFAATAVMFERWEQFLTLEGSDAERTSLISRLVRGIDASEQPLQDAVTVSEIFEMTTSPERLRLLGDVVAAERRRVQGDRRATALFGVLAGRIQQRLAGGGQEGAGAPRNPCVVRRIGHRPAAALLLLRSGRRRFVSNILDGLWRRSGLEGRDVGRCGPNHRARTG